MSKHDDDLNWLFDDEVDVEDKSMRKKLIKVTVNPEYDLPDFLDEGLKAVRNAAKSEDKSTVKRAMFRIYRAIRPFEERDFEKGRLPDGTIVFEKTNPLLKAFADDETIKAFWQDMSEATHCAGKKKFKTAMTVKSALFILVALARAVLDKDDVREALENNGFDFEKYGRKKALKKYFEKNHNNVIVLKDD